MTVLAANVNRQQKAHQREINVAPVNAGSVIYVGAYLCREAATGLAIPGADAANLVPLGVVVEQMFPDDPDGVSLTAALDNTSGADGTITVANGLDTMARVVRYDQRGEYAFAVASGTPKVGDPAYLVDDNTTQPGATTYGIIAGWYTRPAPGGGWFVDISKRGRLTAALGSGIVDVTDSTGASGSHDDTLADGSTIGAALTDNSTGSAGDTIAAGVGDTILSFPLALADFGTSAIDLVTEIVLGFKFKILAWWFVTDVPGVGSGASQVLNLEITATDVGTVVSTLTITEASTSAKGEVTSATAVSGANTGAANATLSVELAASGTEFSAGSGVLQVRVQNMDTADAIASLAAKINTLRTDNIVQNQNDSDLAQKVKEIVAAIG